MLNFDISSEYEIRKRLEKLPYGYKDTAFIKYEMDLISKHTRKVNSATLQDIDSSIQVRDAYVELHGLNNSLASWDLTSYLDNIDIRLILFGARWYNADIGGIKWYYDNGTWLSTTIPNNKDSNKDYYYTESYSWYSNYIIFGYENKEDSNDKFESYRLNKLSYSDDAFHVYVYVFSEHKSYKLSHQHK